MPYIKNLSDGSLIPVSKEPVYANGMWDCGDLRLTDLSGTHYGPAYASMSAARFMDCFTPAEEIAIMGSTDPVVKVFVARLNRAIAAGQEIDPNTVSVQEGVQYLATTNQTPATSPASTYIAPSRVADILSGKMQ